MSKIEKWSSMTELLNTALKRPLIGWGVSPRKEKRRWYPWVNSLSLPCLRETERVQSIKKSKLFKMDYNNVITHKSNIWFRICRLLTIWDIALSSGSVCVFNSVSVLFHFPSRHIALCVTEWCNFTWETRIELRLESGTKFLLHFIWPPFSKTTSILWRIYLATILAWTDSRIGWRHSRIGLSLKKQGLTVLQGR